jgi:hypothetical protein
VIHAALKKTGGNQTKAAKMLGLSRFGLRKKMERCGFLLHFSAGGSPRKIKSKPAETDGTGIEAPASKHEAETTA